MSHIRAYQEPQEKSVERIMTGTKQRRSPSSSRRVFVLSPLRLFATTATLMLAALLLLAAPAASAYSSAPLLPTEEFEEMKGRSGEDLSPNGPRLGLKLPSPSSLIHDIGTIFVYIVIIFIIMYFLI